MRDVVTYAEYDLPLRAMSLLSKLKGDEKGQMQVEKLTKANEKFKRAVTGFDFFATQ